MVVIKSCYLPLLRADRRDNIGCSGPFPSSAGHRVRSSLLALLIWFTPDIVVEPIQIVLHDSTISLRRSDAMPKSLVDIEARWDAVIQQTLIQLVRADNRNDRIEVSMLNHCGSFCLPYIGDGRTCSIYFRIIPRRGVEILSSDLLEVSKRIIKDPFSRACSYRYRLEAIAVSGDPGGDEAAKAPTHGSDSIFINPSSRNQVIDTRDDVPIISNTHSAHGKPVKFRPVSVAAPIIRLQNQCTLGGPNLLWIVRVIEPGNSLRGRGGSSVEDDQ